jgi:hypothetical protein
MESVTKGDLETSPPPGAEEDGERRDAASVARGASAAHSNAAREGDWEREWEWEAEEEEVEEGRRRQRPRRRRRRWRERRSLRAAAGQEGGDGHGMPRRSARAGGRDGEDAADARRRQAQAAAAASGGARSARMQRSASSGRSSSAVPGPAAAGEVPMVAARRSGGRSMARGVRSRRVHVGKFEWAVGDACVTGESKAWKKRGASEPAAGEGS